MQVPPCHCSISASVTQAQCRIVSLIVCSQVDKMECSRRQVRTLHQCLRRRCLKRSERYLWEMRLSATSLQVKHLLNFTRFIKDNLRTQQKAGKLKDLAEMPRGQIYAPNLMMVSRA